jgi:putative peptidoglycan lipid II flippase
MYTTIPIAIITIALGYVFGFYLHMGAPGLALASSISSVFQLAILYILVRRYIPMKRERDLAVSTATYILLGLVMGAAIQLVINFVGHTTDLRFGINVLIQGGLGIFVGALVYLGLAALLRLEEVEFLWQRKKIFTTN